MRQLKKKALYLFAATTTLTTTLTYASETTFSKAQQEDIGKIAADYLIQHPEVLVKVSQALQAKQRQEDNERQKKVQQNAVDMHDRLMDTKGIPVIGPKDATVTVTEFFDYQCFYCNKVSPVVEKLMKQNPNVQFIFRDWPIFASRWHNSEVAAGTGLAIWDQHGAKAYIAYHNGIYKTGHNEGELTTDDIQQVAKKSTHSPFKAAEQKTYQARLKRNDTLAQDLGFTGTPGFVITVTHGATLANTTTINGAASYEVLQAAIDQATKTQ